MFSSHCSSLETYYGLCVPVLRTENLFYSFPSSSLESFHIFYGLICPLVAVQQIVSICSLIIIIYVFKRALLV